MTNNAPDYQDNLVFPPQEPAKRDVVLNYAIISELRDQIAILEQQKKFLYGELQRLSNCNSELSAKAESRRLILEQIIEEITEPEDDLDVVLTNYFSVELIEKIKEAI